MLPCVIPGKDHHSVQKPFASQLLLIKLVSTHVDYFQRFQMTIVLVEDGEIEFLFPFAAQVDHLREPKKFKPLMDNF